MNGFSRASVLIAACALTAGCSAGHDSRAVRQDQAPPLAGASIGGPFSLVDQDGHRRTLADYAGRYRIMYFGYTFCPDVCPTDMQNLAAAMRLLDRRDPAKSARIVPIFVTVDPARDTPAVLKQYVGAFYPRLVGLTGTPAAIAKVAKEYAVFYQKQPASADGAYLVQHSDHAYLMAPDGSPLALVPVDGPPGPIVDTLETWVR